MGDETRELEALVDTGLDGDMIVPSGTAFAEPSIGARTFAWANEALAEGPAYLGTVQLGGFDPVSAEITALGGETVIGRGVIDRYRVVFDHGERVVVEP